MRSLLLVSLIATSSAAVQTRYLDFATQGQSQLLAADPSGNLFVAGTVVEPSGTPQIRVVKTDPSGNVLASFDFGGTRLGSEQDSLAAAATDPEGNIVIVGTTQSPDFPLVAPLYSKMGLSSAFVVKLDAKLQGIQFATLLGGTEAYYSSAGALAIDANSNIYVAGKTDQADFPITPNAFQTTLPIDPNEASGTAFLTEISAAGTQIVFSTFYGGTSQFCFQLGICPFGYGVTAPVALAVDSSGDIFVAGNTTSLGLPTTAGAYSEQCNCAPGFIAKFARGGTKLTWATLLPGSPAGTSTVAISAMALAEDGSVIIGGSITGGIPVTSGSVQPAPPSSINAAGQATLEGFGFVSRINPSGSQLSFSTYLGGYVISTTKGVSSLALDAQGTIWITGSSPFSSMPLSSATLSLGPTYTVALSTGGTALTSALTAPAGASGQAIVVTPQAVVVSLGTSGSLLIGGSLNAPSLVGLTNSAGTFVSGTIAPLELVSLYGVGLGPSPALGAHIVTQGLSSVVSSSLGGVQVLFDGVAAPLPYAGPTQINAIVPLEASSGATVQVQIVTPNGTIAGPSLRVSPSQPQVFGVPILGGDYKAAAALNQDGTLNSQQNPAASGSVVTVWATGAGLFAPGSFMDGTILNAGGPNVPPYGYNLVNIPLPVSVLAGNDSVQVLYAGAAPDAVQGVIQINFRLSGLQNYQLQIGSALSNVFYIYQE